MSGVHCLSSSLSSSSGSFSPGAGASSSPRWVEAILIISHLDHIADPRFQECLHTKNQNSFPSFPKTLKVYLQTILNPLQKHMFPQALCLSTLVDPKVPHLDVSSLVLAPLLLCFPKLQRPRQAQAITGTVSVSEPSSFFELTFLHLHQYMNILHDAKRHEQPSPSTFEPPKDMPPLGRICKQLTL